MIIGVDIGGSKTLVARFKAKSSSLPDLETQQRFATVKDFEAEYRQLVETIRSLLDGTDQPSALVIGSRGEIGADSSLTDRKILGWEHVPLVARLKAEFDCPIELFSDAALATLAEARFGAGQGFARVFYCTISSGIGTGLAINGQLVLDHSGGGDMVVGSDELNRQSRDQTLERLMSGSAITKTFGHNGTEIKDPAAWERIAQALALALNDFIVLTQPDIVVIGGGIAEQFEHYQKPLLDFLKSYSTSQYPLPAVVQAKFVGEAVIYGAALKAQELI